MRREAAELVEKVLPVATYRHAVVSYPFWLNKILGFQPPLLSGVERIVAEEVTRWEEERCLAPGGGVLVRHRARENMEMGIHDHVLLLDRGFTWVPVVKNPQTGVVEVWEARELEQEEVDALAARLWKRIERFLKRRGIAIDPKRKEEKPAPPEQLPLFAAKATQKGHGGKAVGPRGEDEVEAPKGGMWARVAGLHVYVSEPIDGSDRSNLERLCRYLLRPPFSTGRLAERADGKLTYRLKHKDKAGNTELVMTPMEFLARMANLIPGPGQRTRKLFGILAPRSRRRKEVMPKPAAEKCHHPPAREKKSPSDEANVPRVNWAKLLGNLPSDEVPRCPRCLGRMRQIGKPLLPDNLRGTKNAIDLSHAGRGPPGVDAASAQPAA
jgi:hypothetical protein